MDGWMGFIQSSRLLRKDSPFHLGFCLYLNSVLFLYRPSFGSSFNSTSATGGADLFSAFAAPPPKPSFAAVAQQLPSAPEAFQPARKSSDASTASLTTGVKFGPLCITETPVVMNQHRPHLAKWGGEAQCPKHSCTHFALILTLFRFQDNIRVSVEPSHGWEHVGEVFRAVWPCFESQGTKTLQLFFSFPSIFESFFQIFFFHLLFLLQVFRYPNGASKTAGEESSIFIVMHRLRITFRFKFFVIFFSGIIEFDDASSAALALKKKFHTLDG